MNYRIATPDTELGEHSLDDLLSAYTTEDAAAKISVMPHGGTEWTKLWPWLEKQRTERAAEKLAAAKRAASAPGMSAFYKRPALAVVLQNLTLILAGFGIVLLLAGLRFGSAVSSAGFSMLCAALPSWAASVVIDLLARIEFNTRR